MNHVLYNCDLLALLPNPDRRDLLFDCIIADPPDNISLGYEQYDDCLSPAAYAQKLEDWLHACVNSAPIVWFSFNSRHTLTVSEIGYRLMRRYRDLRFFPAQQVITFGQHRTDGLTNNHRPLYCFHSEGAKFYWDQVSEISWREKHGDKRTNKKRKGKTPGDVIRLEYSRLLDDLAFTLVKEDRRPNKGEESLLKEIATRLKAYEAVELFGSDVFDIPRVTGNSKQRRSWHPTQLNELLYERCILLSTAVGGKVCDPFAGTGTIFRAATRLGRQAIGIEIDPAYCQKISEEHSLTIEYQSLTNPAA